MMRGKNVSCHICKEKQRLRRGQSFLSINGLAFV